MWLQEAVMLTDEEESLQAAHVVCEAEGRNPCASVELRMELGYGEEPFSRMRMKGRARGLRCGQPSLSLSAT